MNGNTLVIAGGGNMSIGGMWNGGSLTMNGSGADAFGPEQLHRPTTNVNAGTLQIGVQNGLSSSSAITVASGAMLSMTAASNNTLTVNTVLTLNGGTLSAGAGSTASNYGNFHLGNAGSIAVGANTGTSYITGSLSLNGTDVYGSSGNAGLSPITVGANSTLDISGAVFGVGGLSWGGISKYGAGTLELTGGAGYASGLYLAAGTVAFASGSLSPVNSYSPYQSTAYAVDFEGNATLQWAPGNTQDISGNQGNGYANATGIKIADGVTATFDTNGNNVTLGTAFALGTNMTSALTKTGAGALTLSAPSTYTGATNVNGGTLQIGVQNGLAASSAITVASGAMLSMTAASNNTLTVNNVLTLNGGTLSAGAGATVTNYGNFHLGNAGSIAVGANTGTSYITGSVSLNGSDVYGSSGNAGLSPITVGANSTLDISGAVFGVGGLSWGGISKYGAGTLQVTGWAGYASGLYLAAGTVEFASGSLSPVNSSSPHASTTYTVDFEGNATLQWAPGNTQDISGNQGNGGANATGIKIADGVTATFDTNGNNVTLGTAFGWAPTARRP